MTRTDQALKGVHPQLAEIFRAAARAHPQKPIVTEGLRSLARQKRLVASGASRTLRSKHLTGHAIDVAFIIAGTARWDWPLYKSFADRMKSEARKRQVRLVWGGDWRTFKDGPHFEIIA